MQKCRFRYLCHKLYDSSFEHGNLLESQNLILHLRFTIFSCKSGKGISFPKERKLPRKIPAKTGRKETGQTQLFLPEGNSCSLPSLGTSPGKGDEKDKSPKNIFPKEKASSSNFPKLQKV